MVPNGDYIPKWKLDNAINACNNMEQRADDFENNSALQNLSVIVNGERYKII